MRRTLALALTLAVAIGCTSTTVKKNPGEHDRGFRYYRPKPYLFIQPSTLEENGGLAPDSVSISWEMLPDFSEQYSIRARAGLGVNATKVSFTNGWNLTKVDFDLDSKVDDNVKAATSLILAAGKAAATLGLTGPTVAGESGRVDGVPARNVPLGYYEAVLNDDVCGVKRLYGWRYLGFLPYANCPTTVCGGQALDCRAGEIYGLVNENGVTVFKRLDTVASEGVAPKK